LGDADKSAGVWFEVVVCGKPDLVVKNNGKEKTASGRGI